MFKRSLVFAGFLILILLVWIHSQELPLFFYVLFPLLLFPICYFMEGESHFFLPASMLLSVALYLIYLIHNPSLAIFLFGAGNLAAALLFMFYRHVWKEKLLLNTDQLEIALRELDALKQKHRSRLESLHHLEKQVAGLLDLFEIARDFNDDISLAGTAEILRQRVMPELPFKAMRLILLDKNKDAWTVQQMFSIDSNGVQLDPSGDSLSQREHKYIDKAAESKKLIQNEDELAFPIVTDGELSSLLVVEGSHSDDLAKFEVLAAYMALQIKKVKLYETVRELSIRDGLTGVFVRRHFLQRLDEELKRSIKYDLPLAVLMLDIDHFKRYNDEYGHLAGDATLKQVATLLRDNLRKVDIVGRYGGEEFIVVIPETRRGGAAEVAERIRSSVARHSFKVYTDQTRVTVSIGIALFPDDIPDWRAKTGSPDLAFELIRHADKALYRAKDEGRNRVVLFKDLN